MGVCLCVLLKEQKLCEAASSPFPFLGAPTTPLKLQLCRVGFIFAFQPLQLPVPLASHPAWDRHFSPASLCCYRGVLHSGLGPHWSVEIPRDRETLNFVGSIHTRGVSSVAAVHWRTGWTGSLPTLTNMYTFNSSNTFGSFVAFRRAYFKPGNRMVRGFCAASSNSQATPPVRWCKRMDEGLLRSGPGWMGNTTTKRIKPRNVGTFGMSFGPEKDFLKATDSLSGYVFLWWTSGVSFSMSLAF